MSTFSRLLFVCLTMALFSVPGFSQESNPKKAEPLSSKADDTTGAAPATAGLRKIDTRSQRRNWDVNVHIDQRAIEASIERAVESAMKSVEVAVALERLDIHIEPIEIDLRKLDIDVNPIELNIPELNINIEPIEIDLDEMKIDVDRDMETFDQDDDSGDSFRNGGDNSNVDREKDKDKDKDKVKDKDKNKVKDKEKFKADKDKSRKDDKDKSKGLKKLN